MDRQSTSQSLSEHRRSAKQEHYSQREGRSYFRRSNEFGISENGFTIDMAGVRERKRKMVAGLNEMSCGELQEHWRGADFRWNWTVHRLERTLEVDLPDGSTRRLRGTNVIVSTGTRATVEANVQGWRKRDHSPTSRRSNSRGFLNISW